MWFANMHRRSIYAPYDGGADLFFGAPVDRGTGAGAPSGVVVVACKWNVTRHVMSSGFGHLFAARTGARRRRGHVCRQGLPSATQGTRLKYNGRLSVG